MVRNTKGKKKLKTFKLFRDRLKSLRLKSKTLQSGKPNDIFNIVLVLARSKNKVLGYQGSIPWDIAEDRAFFKKLTFGSICVTGYTTWLTLPNRTLPGRMLFVLSSKQVSTLPSHLKENARANGTIFVQNLETFFKKVQELQKTQKNFRELDKSKCGSAKTKVFCIGGLKVYKAFLPYASTIYLTEIKENYQGDVFFSDELLEGFEKELLSESNLCSYWVYRRK